ncbi:MAG: AAA family ATPase [Candidatus Hermodarchaeota archaeon]
MKVIGFCGLPGSGKSTAIKAIKDLGKVINMGDVVRIEAKIRNLEPTDEILGNIAKDLRDKEGEGIIAQKCVELIKNVEADIIFIDGIRSITEVEIFRKHWKFPLIEIVTKDKLRYKRIAQRERSDDSKDFAEIIERDKREIGFGIIKVLKEANYRIINNSTIKRLEKKTREIVRQIIDSY